MRLSLLAALPLALGATAAEASSDAAFAQFHRVVARSCVKASGLERTRVSAVIGFDDSLGKVAMLVTGAYPQARLRGVTGQMLCVYDKRTGRTWIDEAKGWSAPAAR